MPAILNALDEENSCTIGGNRFTFKPRQLKFFHDIRVARAISKLKADDGFMAIPDEMEHLAHLKPEQLERDATPEEKQIIEAARKQGIQNYCRHLRELHYNATVSLQRDIDMSGAKYDARIHASQADMDRLAKLAKYQSLDMDKDQERIDAFKALEAKTTFKK